MQASEKSNMAEQPNMEDQKANSNEDPGQFSFKTKAAIAAVTVGIFTVGPPLLGFTSAGIAAGSLGAGMMSSSAIASGGGVAAGSTVSILQSIGAAGLGVKGYALIGGAGYASAEVMGRAWSRMSTWMKDNGESSPETQSTSEDSDLTDANPRTVMPGSEAVRSMGSKAASLAGQVGHSAVGAAGRAWNWGASWVKK